MEARNPPAAEPRAHIARATEEDLEAIAELAGVIWRAHYPGIISAGQIEYMLAKMYSLETLREDLRQGGIRYERLLAGGLFLGFAAYGGTAEPRVFKLHKLYLHPQWHGRGLGSLLLRHCEAEAARTGARSLVLSVNKNNVRARAVYAHHGFVVKQAVVVDIGGGFVMDDFIMEKMLDRVR